MSKVPCSLVRCYFVPNVTVSWVPQALQFVAHQSIETLDVIVIQLPRALTESVYITRTWCIAMSCVDFSVCFYGIVIYYRYLRVGVFEASATAVARLPRLLLIVVVLNTDLMSPSCVCVFGKTEEFLSIKSPSFLLCAFYCIFSWFLWVWSSVDCIKRLISKVTYYMSTGMHSTDSRFCWILFLCCTRLTHSDHQPGKSYFKPC